MLASLLLTLAPAGEPRPLDPICQALPYLLPILAAVIAFNCYNFLRRRTERRATEQALSASQENLRLILDSAGEGIYGMDLDGNCTFCNAACVRLLGYRDRSELLGRNIHYLIHHSKADGSPLPMEECRIFSAFKTGEGTHVDSDVLWRADGTFFPAEYRSYPQFEDGKVVGSVVTFSDISERRLSEENLRESHQRLLTILNGLDSIVYVSDVETYELLYANDYLKNNVGAQEGKRCWETIQTGQTGPCPFCNNDKLIDAYGNPTGIYSWQFQNTVNDRWYDIHDRAIRWVDGRLVRLEIATDITERRKFEQLLRQSEENFRNVVECSPLGMLFYRLDETDDLIFTGGNPSADRILGFSHLELLGRRIEEAFPDLCGTKYPDQFRKVARAELGPLYFEIAYDDGRVRGVFEVQVYPSGPRSIAVNFTEITQRKRMEEERLSLEKQLLHAQKLESLGVLAGGIAHDFNNILAVIMGHCSLSRFDKSNTERSLVEIETAAERASDLCRQMLAYAGKSSLTPTRVAPRLLVQEMVTMLRATIPQNVSIRTALSADTPDVTGDAGQLRQIVMNLIINASEAIGNEQGEIRVRTGRAAIDALQAERDYHGDAIAPGSYLLLEVADTGCGMDEVTKWRLFEPFYTTKFTGRGLGMSAVLGIIKSHRGALQLSTSLGGGSTFRIYLPAEAVQPAEPAHRAEQVSEPLWRGEGTVLLVEDDEEIRHIARSMLEMCGFEVLEAGNGQEALELFEGRSGRIAAVLTDMGMPVMDGYALFRSLKELAPSLPIIVSSGFGDVDITSRIAAGEIAGMMSKPYNMTQLRETLRAVLDEESHQLRR